MTPTVIPELSRDSLVRIARALYREGASRMDGLFVVGFLLGRNARRRAGVSPVSAWDMPAELALAIGAATQAIVDEAWG